MLRAATSVLKAQVQHANVDQVAQKHIVLGSASGGPCTGRPLIVQAVRAPAVRPLLWVMRHSPSIFLTVGSTSLIGCSPEELGHRHNSFQLIIAARVTKFINHAGP